MWKSKYLSEFSKAKDHKSAQNCKTGTKFGIDL